ncbi:MAG: very short patch repair endonuclease [Candidatus Omnitrophica bacterium]|nr:very short patch repair endonuclease [Candidatus Omnitrophota bacterium]
MADTFTKRKRSEIMSRIHAKNTGIERRAFSHLRKHRVHFQAHYGKAPGKPDIAVPSRKLAVFIHGDFWHGYRFSAWRRRIPREYWRDKIASNIKRDRKHRRALKRQGWRVLKVWGHELLEDPELACRKIADFMRTR